jgi:hypothetical protein
MYELGNLSESDISALGAHLATLGSGAPHMEDVANKVVSHLYENLGDGADGAKGCVLARFYKTHLYSLLPQDLQAFSDGILGESGHEDMRCLTLLATVGENAEWNSRANSAGHKAIPLPSEDFIGKLPMIARLISQLGMDVSAVIRPDPAFLVDLEDHSYNVFHVAEAVGSPYIPAQDDFVIPYGVRSVVGFGGMLSSGELYTVILFARTQISHEEAERFRPLAGSVKAAIEPFAGKAVFANG